MPANKLGSANASQSKTRGDTGIDYSDIPELSDPWFEMAALRQPAKKELLSIRLDDDVVEWFKQDGRGYQTRINQVLRSYMQHRKAGETPRAAKAVGTRVPAMSARSRKTGRR